MPAIAAGSTWRSERTSRPRASSSLGPDDLWVAGGALLGGGRREAAVLHGLGDDAQLETPPTPEARDSGLMAIASAGPGEPIWAVGFGRETDYVAAYVTRRDDAGWGRAETIRPDGFNAALTDVGASPSYGAWAVGFLQGVPGNQLPWALALRDDGRIGSRLPIAEGERATLAGISVSDDGGIWVAGTMSSGAQLQPYLAVREGDRWQRITVDGLDGAVLADIEVPTAGAGWAVGHRLDGPTIRALILRWDGTAWSAFEAPDTGDEPTLLTSVTFVDGVLSVGGTSWDPEKGRYAPLAARLVDDGWIVSTARRGWGMGTVTDISGDPGDDGWVVGRTDAGLIARVCDSGPPAPAAIDTAIDTRPDPGRARGGRPGGAAVRSVSSRSTWPPKRACPPRASPGARPRPTSTATGRPISSSAATAPGRSSSATTAVPTSTAS